MKIIKHFKRKIKWFYSKLDLRQLNVFLKLKKLPFPQELLLKEEDKCLVLAPHADDEVIGLGGMLLKYPGQFSVYCLCDGRYANPELKPEEMKKVRKKEFSKVMEFLSIKEHKYLEAEDKHLTMHKNILGDIDFSSFDFIFLPNFLDLHVDHRETTSLVKKLIRKKRLKTSAKLVFYEVWAPIACANAFVDISDLKDKKIDLINMYESQTKLINYSQKITGLNCYRGIIENIECAEAFHITDQKTFLKI